MPGPESAAGNAAAVNAKVSQLFVTLKGTVVSHLGGGGRPGRGWGGLKGLMHHQRSEWTSECSWYVIVYFASQKYAAHFPSHILPDWPRLFSLFPTTKSKPLWRINKEQTLLYDLRQGIAKLFSKNTLFTFSLWFQNGAWPSSLLILLISAGIESFVLQTMV